MNYKAIFEALPHVNTIWVKDGNFHLHPNYGGEQINREDLNKSAKKEKEVKEEPKEETK